jgi:hypothetical protein
MPPAVVDELGRTVDQEWRAHHYAPRALADVAAQALARVNLPGCLSTDEILEQPFKGAPLPQQHDLEAKFGQPPITLFHAPRFHIEALHWVDGSTAIHQHGFSGAFQVLAGSSIETTHAFEVEEAFDGHFAFGRLDVTGTLLHGVGAIRPITSGMGGLIHSLFHLDRPSVTIVVRSHGDVADGPQFSYTRNGIAVDPFFREASRERALQFVDLLGKIEHPRLEEMIGGFVESADLPAAYRVLERCSNLSDEALLGRLVDRVSHPGAAGRIAAAFREERRVAFMRSRRSHVRSPDGRFFLGVLINSRDRPSALKLVRERWPDADPASRAAACIRELSAVTLKLQAAGAPWTPNVLGLPRIDDAAEAALAATLRGQDSADGKTGAFLDALRGVPALRCLFP